MIETEWVRKYNLDKPLYVKLKEKYKNNEKNILSNKRFLNH